MYNLFAHECLHAYLLLCLLCIRSQSIKMFVYLFVCLLVCLMIDVLIDLFINVIYVLLQKLTNENLQIMRVNYCLMKVAGSCVLGPLSDTFNTIISCFQYN